MDLEFVVEYRIVNYKETTKSNFHKFFNIMNFTRQFHYLGHYNFLLVSNNMKNL